MTENEVRSAVLDALARVAPEIDLPTLDVNLPVREQVDIDSMDFLSFLVEIHRVLGVDVPESDYQQFVTVSGAVAYLTPRATSTPVPAQGDR